MEQKSFLNARRKIGGMALLLAALVLFSACGQVAASSNPASGAVQNEAEQADQTMQNLSAGTVRIAAMEGDVTITTITGESITPSEDMMLRNGHTLSTGAGSYAYVSLDDQRAIKLDGLTELAVQQRGGHLEVLLLSGQLHYEVAEPLAEEEHMNIRTSNIVTSIRGTSGVVSALWNDKIEQQATALTSGMVDTSVRQVDGEVVSDALDSGFVKYYRPYAGQGEQPLQVLPIVRDNIIDLPAFAIEQMLQNPQEIEAFAQHTGMEQQELVGMLEATVAQNAAAEEAQQLQRQEQEVQDAQERYPQAQESDNSVRNQMFESAPAPAAVPAPAPAPTPAPEQPSTPQTPATPAPATTTTLTGNLTLTQVQDALNVGAPIDTVLLTNATVSGSGALDIPAGMSLKTNNTVTLSGAVTLQGVGTFNVENGTLNTGANKFSVHMQPASVSGGATLVAGEFEINTNFVNSGNITAGSVNVLPSASLQNSGAISATAAPGVVAIAAGGMLANTGTITINPSNINASALSIAGEFSTASPIASSGPIKVSITDAAAMLSAATVSQILASTDCVLVDFTNAYPLSGQTSTVSLSGQRAYAASLQNIIDYTGANTISPVITLTSSITQNSALSVSGSVTIEGSNNGIQLGTNTITVQSGGHLNLNDVDIDGSATVINIADGGALTVTGNSMIEKSGSTAGTFTIMMNPASATLTYTRTANTIIKAVGAANIMGDTSGTSNATATTNAADYGGGGYWVLTTW